MKNITIETSREGSHIVILITGYDEKMRRDEKMVIRLSEEQAKALSESLGSL